MDLQYFKKWAYIQNFHLKYAAEIVQHSSVRNIMCHSDYFLLFSINVVTLLPNYQTCQLAAGKTRHNSSVFGKNIRMN